MPEILPRHYIIGVIMFTFFIVGGMTMLSELQKTNAAAIDAQEYSHFNKTFNVMDKVTEEVDDLEGGITDADTDFGLFGVLNALISSAWQSVKLLFTSFNFMDAAFGGLNSYFGLPAWIGNLVVTLVTVLFIFAILTIIFQREI